MKRKILQQSLAFYFLAVITSFFVLSCEKEDAEKVRLSVRLNQSSGTVSVDDILLLTPTFVPMISDASSYVWTADNPQIVDLQPNADGSVRIIGKNTGVTIVAISSPAGRILSNCQITVIEKEIPDDGILKILAIGNSFSEDALEQHLYGLAQAAGKKIVIGNLYIGGSTLQQHYDNMQNNATAYEYRKINQEGVRTNMLNSTIGTALADENWDFISFQQASPHSGQYHTFTDPLPALYNYVKERSINRQAKYVLHQTWAYAQNSTHAGFANYGYNQQGMYEAIVDTYQQAKTLINADLVVPAGTAIQNGRTSVIGDNFCRDGYHLDLNIGRYTASCTWFEALTGETVVGNSYRPDVLTDYEAELAQQAASRAVAKPYEVTSMSDFLGEGDGNISKPVLINFGTNSSSVAWNTVTGFTAGSKIINLKDEERNYTGIALTITERFNGINPNGPASTTTAFTIPSAVAVDSYFGNAAGIFDGLAVPQSVIQLEGLDKNKKYSFCFFGSRMSVGDNRETKYIVKGQNEGVAKVNASNNSSVTDCVNNIQPDSSGSIHITVTAGDLNNNGSKFFYITAMRVTPSDN